MKIKREVVDLDYKQEYKRVSRENAVLEEKNKTLLEALMKIIIKIL